MTSVAPLFRQLFLVCKNGKIPNRKLVSALQAAHAAKALFIQSARDDVFAWAEKAGENVRKVAAQYRELKLRDLKLATCLKKAWGMHDKNRLGHLRAMSLYGVKLLKYIRL